MTMLQLLLPTLLTARGALAQSAPAPIADVWSAIAPLPFSRSDSTATTVGSLIYIAGGCDGAQNCAGGFCSCSSITANFVAYSPATNAYVTLPSMPAARYRHLACAVGTTIYFFGGRTLPGDAIITTIDAYSTATGSWSTLASAYPAGIGSDNSCSTVGSNIYIMGGYDASYSQTFSNMYQFSPATGAFTLLPGKMVTGRGDFSSVTRTDGTISICKCGSRVCGWEGSFFSRTTGRAFS